MPSTLRPMNTSLTVTCALCSLVVVLYGPHMLGAETADAAPFALDGCQPATTFPTVSSEAGTGDVSRRVIACFEDVLEVFDALAVEANQERATFVAPLLDLYRVKVDEITSLLEQILFQEVSRKELRTFETIVLASRLLDEMVAFEPLLNAPTSVVPTDEKQSKTETAIESFKRLIKEALDAAKVKIPKVLSDTLLDKEGVIDELVKALKPKK
jgi:hypothetical protein